MTGVGLQLINQINMTCTFVLV